LDSITQIALGAAVGEAIAGRQAGWRGAAWGAFLGTLPDLDILAYPFLDSVGQLAFHRGVSHSALFAVAAAVPLGRVLHRLHRTSPATAARWSWLAFLAIATHILLDCFTVYGTQVGWPFTTYPVSFNSLFIIDPLYTLPLLLGTFVALWFKRGGKSRVRFNGLGLAVSTLYVVWSLAAKGIAHQALETGWENHGLRPERTMSNPMPFSTLMWMGIAEERDTLYVGVYGLRDDRPPDRFLVIPKRSHLMAPYQSERAAAELLRFSKGWYSASERDGRLVLDDLRFGRSDAWLGPDGDPIFRFVLEPGDCTQTWCGFSQERPQFANLGESLARLRDRFLNGERFVP
jgi:inner membrane protein